LNELIASRRALLGGLAGLPLLNLASCATARRAGAPAPLSFTSVPATTADTVTVPPGYSWRTLIAWGDPLFENMAPFDPATLTRAEQERRFGTHNDMLALFAADFAYPPPKHQDRMILCANNEYFGPEMAFPNVADPSAFTPAQIEALFTALGVTVVEIEREGGSWRAVKNAAPGQGRNRRITPFTPVQFTGPAARHAWIQNAAAVVNAAEPDRGAPADAVRCGTLANCAGGLTPWGTYLTAEENFQSVYFAAERNTSPTTGDEDHVRDARIFRYPSYLPSVGVLPRQFQFAENPYGPALYGWVVEIDPYDPNSTPKKRTALGRKTQECANTALTRDRRVAAYMGDDQPDEHVYKFVTQGHFDPANRAANMDLLDEGQLYCALFEADGTGRWLAMNAEAANAAAQAQGSPIRFRDAADVAIRAREAARLMGATPMDRPEDVEPVCDANWVGQGPVLIVCTKTYRPNAAARAGNPTRADEAGTPYANLAGHVLRINEADSDCASESFTWEAFVVGGDANAESLTALARDGRPAHVGAGFGTEQNISGDRFACPDNIFIDSDHRVWISTDGSPDIFADCNDCVLATPLAGAGPRPLKRFLVGPVGAEICGPLMAPDERAFFCAIQHPGESDVAGIDFSETRWRGAPAPSSFPDGGWPRSAVVVVTRDDGGRIGD